MDFSPDSVLSTNYRFITDHVKVFPKDDSLLPSSSDHCSLVAVAPKYGLIFVGLGKSFKVYQSQALLGDGEKKVLGTLEVGANITHLVASCDGLTLMVVVLHNDVPHALFYEVRSFVPGCPSQTPFASTTVCESGGSRVLGIAWNPMDPNSIAVAASPASLIIITLSESSVQKKAIELQACAVGWSPKGKQLTVGLSDGSLALFKPDLTPVRNIARPPMDELGEVLSITWFTSTEFFISYKLVADEGGHVMMFISAPKGKEAKYVLYEFLCNDNQGPRPPMFYPVFIPEWSVLCVLSSRAFQAGMLGKPENGGEGWCEYEMEEGSGAGLNNISVTEETYALGMAIDFTSLKSFTNKDQSTSGPCPVLYALSTGGELNSFHLVNNTPGAPKLTKMAEAQPMDGHRTAQQYPGVASYIIPAPAPATLAPPAPPKLEPALTSGPTTLFGSSSGIPAFGSSTFQAPADNTQSAKPSLPPATSSSPFSFGTSFAAGGGSLFSGMSSAVPKPANTAATPSIFQQPATTTSAPPATTPMPSFQFKVPVANVTAADSVPKSSSAQPPPAEPAKPPSVQPINFSSLPKADTGSISQGRPAAVPICSTPVKPSSPTPIKAMFTAKPAEPPAQPPAPSSSHSPSPMPEQKASSGKDGEADLIPTIAAITANFEQEFQTHLSNNQCQVEIGRKDEMGRIRSSLTEEKTWIDQMASTTGELKSEVAQLHSKVLEGYTLREEAEGQLNKRKNPRHVMSLQARPLDPQSRKRLEEIRSRYQYLQSQLTEVNTRLHLDWAEFTNAAINKKKKDLPASETLYHALLKNHSFRVALDKQLDVICEKVKALQLQTLSGSLLGSYQDDEDVFASLEKSMRETSISSSMHMTPVKMLPAAKQDKLQKLLAQRTNVPVRKCVNVPKMDLSALHNSSGLGALPDTSSMYVQHSVSSISSPRLDITSFGPQTFSTPNRPAGNGGLGKPQYEDISPPQTPSSNAQEGNKGGASPLLALSSLVSKVPKSTEPDVLPSTTITPSFEVSTKLGTTTQPEVTKTSDAPPAFNFSGASSTISSTGFSLSAGGTSLPTASAPSFSLPAVSVAASVSSSFPTSSGPSATFTFKAPSNGTSGLFSGTTITIVSTTPPSVPSTTTTMSFSAPSSLLTTSASLFSKTPLASTLETKPLSSAASEVSSSPAESESTSAQTPAKAATVSIAAAASEAPVPESSSEAKPEAAQTSSIFGGAAATLLSSSGSLFGGASITPKTLFNTSITAVTTSAAATTSASSLFQTSSSAAKSLFSFPSSVTVVAKSDTSAATTTTTAGPGFFATSSLPPTSGDKSDAPTSSSIFSSSLSGGSLFTSTAVTTAATGSIFGTAVSSAATGSIFGTAASSAATDSIFATAAKTTTTTAGSLFSLTASTPAPITTLTTPASGSATSITTTAGSLFGSSFSTATSGASLVTSGGGSVFGTATSSSTPGSLFGGSVATSSSTAPQSSLATTTSGGSLFGSSVSFVTSSATTSASTTSIFGAAAVTASSTGSLFGGASSSVAPAVSSSSIAFGTATTTPSSSGSIFGTPASSAATSGAPASSTSGSVFEIAGGSALSSGSIFGTTATVSSSLPASSTPGSIFGTAVSTTSSSGSLFGSPAPAATSASSIPPTSSGASMFGTPASLSSTIFSSPPPASSASAFGSSVFGALTTSGTSSAFSSLSSTSGSFGLNTATTTTNSVFGQATSPGTTSVFGQTAPSSTGSLFGGQATTSASVFGSSTQGGSVFGSAGTQSTGMFGGAASQTSSASVFGSTVSTGFGSGTTGSVFGQTQTQSASPFGNNSSENSNSSVFGGSTFGGSSGGGPFSGLGGKPNQENADKNVFGGLNFGAAKPQTGLFEGGGTQGNSTFGGSAFGGSTSSPASGGTFGTATTQKSATAFGGAPAFGGGAAFGGAPAFGSPPKFGSTAAFGATATFGSAASPAGSGGSAGGDSGFSTFGSAFGAGQTTTSTTSGFGNFAAQDNTMSFGGIAQNTTGSAFGGGNTFGGGSSFNSWR